MTSTVPPFGWILNLDAELELARPSYRTRVKLSHQLEEHGKGALALLGPRDVVARSGTDVRGMIGRAWCPTPMALAALRAAGVEPEPHPSASVLIRVNHRRFAFELGGGLHEQSYVEERSSLEALFAPGDRRWLLKRPLSFAGRGQLRIYDSVSEKQWAWIDASLRHDGLIVEPFIVPVVEFSLHGFVWRNGRSELGRACVQDVSERGVFRGVRLAEPSDLDAGERRVLFVQGERVATALGAAGYFGPFGIDAYRFRDGERTGFCGLGEINARYTMSFVTGFPRHPSELVLE